jgi:threonine/homoserine/homoserine lactone efflux protein
MDWQLFGIFVVTALWETLHPGPTLALVVDTRARFGPTETLFVVAGITLANVAWVVAALALIYAGVHWVRDWMNLLVALLAVPFLVFLASTRILTSMVQFVAMLSPQRTNAPVRKTTLFATAFVAHLVNPLSIGFYLATFSALVSGKPLNQGILFGIVPIVMDSLVFGSYALLRTPLGDGPFARVLPLLAGVSMVAIVSQIVSQNPEINFYREGTELVMIAALLLAALHVARSQVILQRGKNSRALWRVVALWDSWFKVAAVVGAIVAVATTLNIDPMINHRIRICFVVAGVLAASLSFAKAYGELQDERFPSQGGNETRIDTSSWQASEVWVGVAAFGFLAAVFLLVTLAGNL